MRLAVALALVLTCGLAFAKPAGNGVMPGKRDTDPEVGRRLYQRSCWECHGEYGKGDGPSAPALIGGVPTLEGKVDDEAGYDDLVTVIEDGKGRMPAYNEDIDKHDARRILQYLHDLKAGTIKPTGTVATPKDDDKDKDEDQNQN